LPSSSPSLSPFSPFLSRPSSRRRITETFQSCPPRTLIRLSFNYPFPLFPPRQSSAPFTTGCSKTIPVAPLKIMARLTPPTMLADKWLFPHQSQRNFVHVCALTLSYVRPAWHFLNGHSEFFVLDSPLQHLHHSFNPLSVSLAWPPPS